MTSALMLKVPQQSIWQFALPPNPEKEYMLSDVPTGLTGRAESCVGFGFVTEHVLSFSNWQQIAKLIDQHSTVDNRMLVLWSVGSEFFWNDLLENMEALTGVSHNILWMRGSSKHDRAMAKKRDVSLLQKAWATKKLLAQLAHEPGAAQAIKDASRSGGKQRNEAINDLRKLALA